MMGCLEPVLEKAQGKVQKVKRVADDAQFEALETSVETCFLEVEKEKFMANLQVATKELAPLELEAHREEVICTYKGSNHFTKGILSSSPQSSKYVIVR